MGSRAFTVGILLVCVLYLVLRVGFPRTIEFGYDQPRLATRIIEYINNTKVFETQKFAERSPWGNISWGPALFYFYSPFFILSKNPIVVSNLVSIFNLGSILLVMFIAKKYVSETAAVVSGLFLATHPWWLIFSRMIYQPTPIVTLSSVSIFVFFKVLEKPKSFWVSILIFLLIFMVELYFHSFSFAVSSIVLLVIFLKKKILNRFLIFGVVLSSLLVIPFFNNFSPKDYISKEADNVEDRYKIGRDDPVTRIKYITPGFLRMAAGEGLEYQLGYSFEDFFKEKKVFPKLGIVILALTSLIIFYHLAKVFFDSKLRRFRMSVISWVLAPALFLILIPLPNVPPIPRYFLIAMVPLSLAYGLFFTEVFKNYPAILTFLIIPIYFTNLNLNYFSFIQNYNYPMGHLSTYSDTPYYFLYDAMRFALNDGASKGFGQVVISNDEASPKVFALDWASRYLWDHVFAKSRKIDGRKVFGYYLIDYSLKKEDRRYVKLGRFGPYSVYEYRAL